MFYLRMARIFQISFALPIMNPDHIPTYDLIHNTPLFNIVCFPLSEKRKTLSKTDLNEYMCLCIKTENSTKRFVEHTYNFARWLKITKRPLLKTLLESFGDILEYLQTEFVIQEQTINRLKVRNRPLSRFFVDNYDVPLEKLYSLYSEFLIDHLLEKYEDDFKKLKVLYIPSLLKRELDFVNCHCDYSYHDGEFKTVLDAVKSINKRVMGLFSSIIKIAS